MITLTPDTADFRARTTIRDKEGHYIMIKKSLHQKVSNPKYACIKQQSHKTHEVKTGRTKGKIERSTVTFGDFKTPSLNSW